MPMRFRKKKSKRKQGAKMKTNPMHDSPVGVQPPPAAPKLPVELKNSSVAENKAERVQPPAPVQPDDSNSGMEKDNARTEDLTAKVYAALDQVAAQYVSGPMAEVQKAAEAALQGMGLETVTSDALKDRALLLSEQASKAVSETVEKLVKAVDQNTPASLKTEAKSLACKAHEAVGPENIKALQEKATELTAKASEAMTSGLDQATKAVNSATMSSAVDSAFELKTKAVDSVQDLGTELVYWMVLVGVWLYMQFEDLQTYFWNMLNLAKDNVSDAGEQISKMLPADFSEAKSSADHTYDKLSEKLTGFELFNGVLNDVATYIKKIGQPDAVDSKSPSTTSSVAAS